MKKGKIVNLVRQIPEDSPFKTYKDMKRYWKNTVIMYLTPCYISEWVAD